MCIARPIPGYKALVETCRQRADELAISRLELDRIAGLPSGYSAKLLGRDGAGPKQKRLWPIGLEVMLSTLGLQVILIEDPAATARTLALRDPVDRRQQRFGNQCNSKAPLEIAAIKPLKIAAPQKKPEPESRAHLRVIQGKKGRIYASRQYG